MVDSDDHLVDTKRGNMIKRERDDKEGKEEWSGTNRKKES